MHCFSFDIETVPDVELGRELLELDGLSDEDVATAMMFKRQQAVGHDFLALHQHRVVAISITFRTADTFKVWSLGDESSDERELVERFFDGIERYSPDLISWNGGGFDLPVLHYRALRHGIVAQRYWEMGEDDREFKWNNYISRYHSRHLDLMDLLALYNLRAAAPLDEIARLCGFPGKLGMDGSQVWPAWQQGRIEEIRNYCETDVANTWLVYCRFQQFRGGWSPQATEREIEALRTTISGDDKKHWQEFLAAWPG